MKNVYIAGFQILTWDELVQIMGKQNNIEVSSSTLIDIVRLLHNVVREGVSLLSPIFLCFKVIWLLVS